jgi:hypothetical protein
VLPERVIGLPTAYGPALAWIEMNPREDEDVDDVTMVVLVVVVVEVVVVVVGRKSIPLSLVFGLIVTRDAEFEL